MKKIILSVSALCFAILSMALTAFADIAVYDIPREEVSSGNISMIAILVFLVVIAAGIIIWVINFKSKK